MNATRVETEVSTDGFRRTFPSNSSSMVFIAFNHIKRKLKLHNFPLNIQPAWMFIAFNHGSSITAGSNDSWPSLSNDFAFGFYSLPNNLYLVGIWFNKIPERTLVWSANRDSPAVAGSTVNLTSGGQLTLTHLNGTDQSIYSGGAAVLGTMENDGNFVLTDGISSVVWQSFNSPTDTILPGQNLSRSQKLYSNANGTVDYSTGNFMLEMQNDGNLVLSAYRFADPGYWYTKAQPTTVSLEFNNDTAFMYLVNTTGDNVRPLTENVPTPVGDYYYRATINDHGDFQQFAHHKSNSSGWTTVWRAIGDPCVVNAICGVNGMCFSQNNETEKCGCIPGYTPLDPNHVSKGCRPETVVNYCAGPSMKNFTIEVIDDADFPFENFADLARVKNVDLEGCKKALMDDCYSVAASLVESRCIKKRMPLLNARQSDSTKGIQALVKVPMKSSPGIPEHKKKNDFDVRVFLKISVIVTATLAFFFGVSSIYYHPAPRRFITRRRYSNANSIDPSRVEEESEEDDLVLSDWVISCMAAGKLETVVGHDPEVLSDFERFERMALVGLWCIHPDAMFRPSMKKVTQMLEGTLEIGIPPSLSDQMSVSNYNY
ncbi:hypothetical protein OIU84_017715 [Salix udensis]|uniref:Bulb-type lectin domain-containing protein n=1 Tax=Salix udensis TaxID=889485 RepID=A0AAD6L2H0_9ROSI|nr:hypothetical protein OIU84_017715 [Salix udensis]